MKEILLETKDISISFGGVHAVQNVNFQVYSGEILGLIGPNGSGKSTCVNLISSIYKLDSGEIHFEGKKLNSKDTTVDRSKVGISRTFQTPKPFTGMTVYDNVFTIALLRHSFSEARKKTDEILAFTGLGQSPQMNSEKLPIEKRKWLDLARILATDPKIIMLDEVLAGLNQAEMEESLELVRQINQEKRITILFIEHIIKAVVSLCDRVVVLNGGTVLAEGKADEVIRQKNVIDAYIGGVEHAED